MSHLRLRLCVVIGALIGLFGSANAFAAGNLVVSQVYGGGGNTGASYTHDFIELFNRGAVSEPLQRDVGPVRELDRHRQLRRHYESDHRLPSVALQPGQYLLIQEPAMPRSVHLPRPT